MLLLILLGDFIGIRMDCFWGGDGFGGGGGGREEREKEKEKVLVGNSMECKIEYLEVTSKLHKVVNLGTTLGAEVSYRIFKRAQRGWAEYHIYPHSQVYQRLLATGIAAVILCITYVQHVFCFRISYRCRPYPLLRCRLGTMVLCHQKKSNQQPRLGLPQPRQVKGRGEKSPAPLEPLVTSYGGTGDDCSTISADNQQAWMDAHIIYAQHLKERRRLIAKIAEVDQYMIAHIAANVLRNIVHTDSVHEALVTLQMLFGPISVEREQTILVEYSAATVDREQPIRKEYTAAKVLDPNVANVDEWS